jgi:hypothetical protein
MEKPEVKNLMRLSLIFEVRIRQTKPFEGWLECAAHTLSDHSYNSLWMNGT